MSLFVIAYLVAMLLAVVAIFIPGRHILAAAAIITNLALLIENSGAIR